MINRIVVLSTLILALAVSINWLIEDREKSPVIPLGNDPDLYMLKATINQFNKTGQLQHSVSAERFTHFPLTDLTTMKLPVLELGKTRKSSPWAITSKEGRLIPASEYREEIVELWDEVLAERTGSNEFINIQTNSLTVYPERDYAETDEKVYIDSHSGRTSAAGMKAFLESGRFMFYSTPKDRVTTIFLPN